MSDDHVHNVRDLIERGVAARRADEPAAALTAYSEAVRKAREVGADALVVAGLHGVAQIHRDEGGWREAIPPYEEAIALCRSLGDDARLAHELRHLGDLLLEHGLLAEADLLLAEAASTARAVEGVHPLELANTLRPLAVLRSRQGRAEEARPLWTETRRLYRGLALDAGVEEADDWLARLDAEAES